jgi:hypothetical protein
MIRLVYPIRRLPHLTLAEFHAYWHDIHGPLMVKNARALAATRYIQVHTIDDPVYKASREARGMTEAYDGVVEIWWDSMEAAAEAAGTPEGREANRELLEDEKSFIDFSRSSLWFAMELPQVNPTPENIIAAERSTIVKFYYVLHRLPNLSREDFQLYWRMNHGPLIRSWALAMGILRYIQVHTLDDALAEAPRTDRGKMEAICDGHAELWFDRGRRGKGANQAPEELRAGLAAAEDEAKFIDFSRSSLWTGKEHLLLER